MLPVLAQALRVSVEELIDGQSNTRKRGPTGKIQQQLEQVQQLQRTKQKNARRHARFPAGHRQLLSKVTTKSPQGVGKCAFKALKYTGLFFGF
jgi:hypothetical protein